MLNTIDPLITDFFTRRLQTLKWPRHTRCILRCAWHNLPHHTRRHDPQSDTKETGRIQHVTQRSISGQELEYKSSSTRKTLCVYGTKNAWCTCSMMTGPATRFSEPRDHDHDVTILRPPTLSHTQNLRLLYSFMISSPTCDYNKPIDISEAHGALASSDRLAGYILKLWRRQAFSTLFVIPLFQC